MPANRTYKVTDLCEAATDGDVTKIQQILDAQPDPVNTYMAENNEHCANHKSGIYPHREATDPFTIAQDRGYYDTVEIRRE